MPILQDLLDKVAYSKAICSRARAIAIPPPSASVLPPRADSDEHGSITCGRLCQLTARTCLQVLRDMASFLLSALLVLAATSSAAAQNVPGYWNGIALSNPALLTNVRSVPAFCDRESLPPRREQSSVCLPLTDVQNKVAIWHANDTCSTCCILIAMASMLLCRYC